MDLNTTSIAGLEIGFRAFGKDTTAMLRVLLHLYEITRTAILILFFNAS